MKIDWKYFRGLFVLVALVTGVMAVVLAIATSCAMHARIGSVPAAVAERVVVIDRGTQEMMWVCPEAILVLDNGVIKVGFHNYHIVTAEGEPMSSGDVLEAISSPPDTLFYGGDYQ
jgi:hypothetical protein